jgi:hypothetical protein
MQYLVHLAEQQAYHDLNGLLEYLNRKEGVRTPEESEYLTDQILVLRKNLDILRIPFGVERTTELKPTLKKVLKKYACTCNEHYADRV